MTPAKQALGTLLRHLRQERRWTLRELSLRSGIPASTLAKVEHGRLTLGYDRLVQLSERLQLPISRFFAQAAAATRSDETNPAISARRSIGRLADAIRTSTRNYDNYELCAELRRKQMLPAMTIIRTQQLGELQRDRGEQFIYVLHGAVEVHTEFYAPLLLRVGESLYIDANMAYACIAADNCAEARVLRVVSQL